MRLRNLATFIKVASLGSFHAAAQQLHSSQPAISARIAALESELGVKLFVRDQSGTRITARGSQLLPYAEKLLAINKEMKEQLQQEQPEKGALRIGIADTLSHLWLAPLLKHWQTLYPQISFELTSDVTPTLIHQLQNHQIDLALMVTDQTSADLITYPLCSYSQCWVASDKLFQNTRKLETTDLAKQPVLSFPRNTRPWHYLQTLFHEQAEPPVIHTCSSVANLLNMAKQGVGIVLLPIPVIEQYLASGELIKLSVTQEPPPLEFSYSWRLDDDRNLPKALAESGREIMQASTKPL